MQQEVITGGDFRRMISGAYSELILEHENINELNEGSENSPYSGKPGTDVLRTMGAAIMPLDNMVNESIGGISRRIASAAVLGSRGNAGVVMGAFLRGMAKGFKGKYNATSNEFGKAFQYGILFAQKAESANKVILPFTQALVSVAKACFTSIRAGLPIYEILTNAITDGLIKGRTDAELDVGEKMLLVFLTGCKNGLNGNYVSPVLAFKGNDYQGFPGTIKPTDDEVMPYCVNFLVENTNLSLSLIEEEMREVGTFVVVEIRGIDVFVHLHAANPGQVLERAVGWGHLKDVHIKSMAEPHDMIGIQLPQLELAVLTIASTDEMGERLEAAGATVIIKEPDVSGPSVEDVVNAVHGDMAKKYILLTNTDHVRLVMAQAKRILEGRVEYVVAHNEAEQLAALRAFYEERDIAANAAAMKAAVLVAAENATSCNLPNYSF